MSLSPRHIIGLVILVSVCACFATNALPRRRDFPSDKDRKKNFSGDGERYEGFREYENISLGALRFVSAQIEWKDQDVDKPKCYNVGFYLPDSLDSLDILVEEINTGYYMVPHDYAKKYPQGFHRFSWESDFALQNEINLSDLSALIKLPIRGSSLYGYETIVPVLFYYEDLPEAIEEYRFSFVSSSKVSMKFYVIDEAAEELLYEESISGFPANEQMNFFWEVGNTQEGSYLIRTDVMFLDKEISDWSIRVYKFYHIPNLLLNDAND